MCVCVLFLKLRKAETTCSDPHVAYVNVGNKMLRVGFRCNKIP